MNLTTRLAMAMIALVLFTATAVGVLTYRNVATISPGRSFDRIHAHVRLLALDLEASVRSARGDIMGFRSAVAVEGIVRGTLAGDARPQNELTAEQWRNRLAARFVAELNAKREYSQFQLIGTASGGREIMRVHRTGPNDAIRIAADDELQPQGDNADFRKALALSAGEIYVSPVELYRDNGAIRTPLMPVMVAATPIHGPDGRAFGVLMITVDLRAPFTRIREAANAEGALYVINDRGDYLVHPDRSREFGFEFGKSFRVQDDFPGLTALLAEPAPMPRLLDDREGRSFGVALASERLAGGPRVSVVETMSHAQVMAAAIAVRNSSVVAGILATLGAGALALALARSLTRPLVQMTRAVEAVGGDRPVAIPTNAAGEIGTLARTFARMIDEVRDKIQTQQALSQEMEERRRLFETSLDLILVTDRKGSFVQVSPISETILGYRPDEMIGRTAVDFIHPDDLENTRTEMRAARRGGVIRNFETRYLHKHRRVVSMAWTGVWSEPVQRYFFIGRDMTEAKKAQQALLESEQMARGIVETALDAFVQMDSQGLILEWNSQAEKLFGWQRAEAVGKSLRDLIIPERHRERHQQGLARYLRTGVPTVLGKRIELEALRRDGTEFNVELAITALRRGRGYVFNGFIRDLTEKLAADEQIRQSQKMDAVGQLTGGIAHDFNNILTVIIGTIEFLAEGVADRPKLATFAQMIDEAAQRGADLTQSLLAFARKQPLQPQETNVNTLVGDAARLLKPTLGEHVDIGIQLEDGAWSALVDPVQLTTAVLNLAINARDAMPDGGKLMLETGNVYLDDAYAATHAEVRPGEYVMLAVSDTGSGIPAAVRDKVFEPFFTTKEVGKGTGLGLSMVYGFVKQSGGHVKIYSEEGHGTTIKIYLPRSVSDGATQAQGQATAPIQGGHETILVVEDDQMVRDYVVAQLQTLGYQTLVAANSTHALALADSGLAFDLLFTDVIMPGVMNGRQLAEAMAKRRPGLKVLFTSGYTENAIVHHGRLDAGVHLLAKPYRKSDLARMIRVALAGAGNSAGKPAAKGLSAAE
jgi:PAS domain S-box-containing protein